MIDEKLLELKSKQLRKKTLDISLETGVGHIGGCFSEIEILIALYEKILKPEDKFILSKGHACQSLFVLLKEKGLNPTLSGHPDIDEKNGIFCTTGSLGHGLPIGVGMAFARKLKGKKGVIYVLVGDGECQEGAIWESIPLAVKYKLDNLVIIVDNNRLQALESIEKVSPINLKKVFEAFGCSVLEVDGHNFPELIGAFGKKIYGKPKVIIANTIKGKGVSYMENVAKWHGRTLIKEEVKQAYEELR